MLGDLQRRKASHYFDLIDEDDNGFIEARDFEMRADRMAEARDVTEKAARATLRTRVMTWWNHLCAVADFDDDDRVTREEWETYWQSIQVGAGPNADADNKTLQSLERAARGTFHAINTGEGPITLSEYDDWLAAWGVEESRAAFDRLDRSGTGTLSEDDLVTAVKEFYLSNDPEAPGNALYGTLPR